MDYKLEVSNETKKYITEYFKNIKNDEKKLIKVNNFTAALRKLISRSLAGSRQDIDIKFDAKLILYINRGDLWPQEFLNEENNDEFVNELYMICKDDLIIGNCLDLYNCLDGDNILNEEIAKNKAKFEEKKNDNQIDDKDENDNGRDNLDDEEQNEEGDDEDNEDNGPDDEYDERENEI